MNVSLLGIFLGTFAVLGVQAKEKPSSQFPIDLGVSLIFPRPNETYRPVYPFPVVFALTGAAKAWPYGFKLQWRLEGNWTTPIKKEDVPIDYGSSPDWLYSSGSLEPATEPYFVVNATDIMSNTSCTEWELGWSLSVLQECSPGPERYWKYGSINFSISSSGLLPSYKPKRPCPLEIQHTRFLDNRTTPKEVIGDRRSESCMVVTDKEGEGDPCSVDTGHELAAMVRAEMLSGLLPLKTFKSLWQTVDKVENGTQSKLDRLVKSFVPDVDESSEFSLIEEFLGIAVGMFVAPFFNKIMQTKDSPTAGIKDLVADTASWGN
ncbi:hypothetical protein FMUND_1993 [Fusarium mundagurra]|uniref:DUF7136 domain-containing protein n=1 Tax=Fusarium mundagurra TaxID=1567541 RepID=A0A8H6DNE6_9HYPO|nr:hypothetical protein FMUND_1993 [Fusarium mundagurra]